NQDDILPKTGDLRLDLGFRAGSEADGHDHRPHAADNAQHRQKRAQLIPAQCAQRNPHRGAESFHQCNCTACWAARNRANSASAILRFLTRVSVITCPSRIITLRFVYCAMSSSCVTMMIVMPCSLSF